MQTLRRGAVIAAFKTAGFGYTFINDNAGVPETERNRKGVAGVAAQDYARQASAFFGDRPLDNPGYGKIEFLFYFIFRHCQFFLKCE